MLRHPEACHGKTPSAHKLTRRRRTSPPHLNTANCPTISQRKPATSPPTSPPRYA